MIQIWYFYGALAWVALMQVLWLLLFSAFAFGSEVEMLNKSEDTTWRGPKRVYRAWRLSTASVATRYGVAPADFHQRLVDTFKQQKADAVTIGGLGLAAWGILDASKSGLPTGPLRLLFLGVIVNLAGATLFRIGPTERSYFGLEAFLIVGFFATVLALLAFVPSVFETNAWQRDILEAVAVIGAALETVRAVSNIRRHRVMFYPK